MKLKLFILLLLTPIFTFSGSLLLEWKPGVSVLLQPTERKPARTAVLIMAPPDDDLNLNTYRDCRWLLGKKAWEHYMNAHPHVDCYFLQDAPLRKGSSEQIWIEGNTIFVGDASYKEKGITVAKTIAALEKLLPKYTHFFRTNINAFVNLKALNDYAETHHRSMFTGPLWQQPFWYILGYGLLFSADVATHIVKEYRKMENFIISINPPEDLILNSLATGVFPYYGHINHKKGDLKFTCCPTLPPGIPQLMCGSSFTTTRLSMFGVQLAPAPSLEEALDYCKRASPYTILYRVSNGFDLDKLAELYQYLLNNIYPELTTVDLVEYAKSLPTILNGYP